MILNNRFRMHEEEEPKEDKKEEATPFLNKKMEQIFFEKRAIYLWGVVDDKSAKDIVTKLLLLKTTLEIPPTKVKPPVILFLVPKKPSIYQQ